jgi:hypothetical protein
VHREGNKLVVRGTTSDAGEVKRVMVNGQEAKPVCSNFAEWEVEIDTSKYDASTLRAHAEDAAGNTEKRPHIRTLR